MRYFTCCLLIFATNAAQPCPPRNEARELSSLEQVKTELAKPGPFVVMYSADWCVTCQEVKPTFKETAAQTPSVKFLILDVDKVQLKEHTKIVNHIPLFLVGKDENSLRNKPCVQPDNLEYTVVGFKKFITKCLGK